MGIYLNPGNELFARITHNDIYVDKSGMMRNCQMLWIEV